MKTPWKVWILMGVLGATGAALFGWLLARHGAADVMSALHAAGWGLAVVVVFHLAPLFFDVLSWRALVPKDVLRLHELYWIRWIGDSVSSMLPVAQVGGEVVRVRLANKHGLALPLAGASVLVGMTVCVGTQIVFTLSGLIVLVILTGHGGLVAPVVLASVIGVAAVGGFYAVQRVGIFRIVRVIVRHVTKSEHWNGLVDRGAALDDQVRTLYGNRRAVLECAMWTMCNWAAGAVEVWIALWALGVHVGYGHAYVLESMSQGIRSAAFLIPGALGVQEGGYLLIGGLLGIPAETALALALVRRVRELAFGVPGVIAWQLAEGRWLLAGYAKGRRTGRHSGHGEVAQAGD